MHQPSTVDSLFDVAQAARARGECSYWLIDRSAMPSRWLGENLKNQLWVDVLRGRGAVDFTAATPVLMDASEDDQTRFIRFAAQLHHIAANANAVSFLTSPLKMDVLQTALRSRARVELPARLEMVLRYFDTRTLPLLPDLFTPVQYAGFVQDVSSWYYLDRRGELRCLPPAPSHKTGELASQAPWVLDDAQEAMLIDDGLTDAMIDYLLTQALGGLMDLSPPEQFDKVDCLVARARHQGVREHLEVFEFVVNSLDEAIA